MCGLPFIGLNIIPIPDHTPGHTSYKFESNNDNLLFLGDLILISSIQFADPLFDERFDVDTALAKEQGTKYYKDAAQKGNLIAVSQRHSLVLAV
jgi:glyoxylase-like metal-dependent hydrolase (beta-lactamase superfamily II)